MSQTTTTLKVSTALQTAVQHHSAGRLEDAEQLYDAVLGALPDHADALHLRGILACQQGALDHAADLLTRAVTVDGEEPDYYNSLGNVRILQGAYGDAAVVLGRALELNADHPEALVNIGVALYGEGRAEQAASHLQRSIALAPDNAQAWSALGLIAFEAGDFAGAATQLRTAAALGPRFAYGAACVFGDEFEAYTDPAAIDTLLATAPELGGEMPAPERAGMVVTSACDHGYFRNFGRALALSLDRNAPGHELHLHLFNPEPGFDEELAELKSRLGRTRLTVSRETMKGADPVYFSNMRFVRLYQIMRDTGRDLFSLDTDSLVRGSLDELVPAMAGADVALTQRPEKAEIGHKMLATSICFRATEGGLAYLGRVAAYILSCHRDRRLAWYIDQSALYLVHRMMERSGAPPALAQLPPGFADSDFSPDSAVWAAKGERKLDAAFVAEAARLAG